MISVKIHAMGYILKEELDEQSISVGRAIEIAARRNGKDPEEFLGEDMVYLCGGRRVFADDILVSGDTLSALTVPCGG